MRYSIPHNKLSKTASICIQYIPIKLHTIIRLRSLEKKIYAYYVKRIIKSINTVWYDYQFKYTRIINHLKQIIWLENTTLIELTVVYKCYQEEVTRLLISTSQWACAWDFQQCGMCDQQRLRAFASRLSTLWLLSWTPFGVSKLKRRLPRLVWVYTCKNATLLEISCTGSEPVHGILNNVLCATSKASDQPAHTRSLIRDFASRLSILWLLSYWLNTIWSF